MNSNESTQGIGKPLSRTAKFRQSLRHCRGRQLAGVAAGVLAAASALANGGPFVVKYPGGDPAAKGVLARLDPSLQPARESRLRVIQENLNLRFEPERLLGRPRKEGEEAPPLVAVTAEYFITNTTPEAVEVDFGFPILRGIYVSPFSMMPSPDAQVRVDGTNYLRPAVISNSALYGILRRQAAETLERALQADAKLQRLCAAVQTAPRQAREPARQALADYLKRTKRWPAGDAALFVEYVSLAPAPATGPQTNGVAGKGPLGRGFFWWENDATLLAARQETAWAVQAIGEQKATQWLTHLAKRLDAKGAASYEAVFQSWGGDVRERSVDLQTGQVRPREISLGKAARPDGFRSELLAESDPTVYARVDYFSDSKDLTDDQKAAWNAVLQQLPVTFTFAPMNLLHYRVVFAPGAVRTVTVSYRQYAYLDTRGPRSYQVAYVIHPASLWKSFGPIHLHVATPTGVTPVGSVALGESGATSDSGQPSIPGMPALRFDSHIATLTDKKGELFVGINADAWVKAVATAAATESGGKVAAGR